MQTSFYCYLNMQRFVQSHNISLRGTLLVETEDQIHQLEVDGPNWHVEIENLTHKHREKDLVCICLELHRSKWWEFVVIQGVINRKWKIQFCIFLPCSLDLDEHFSSRWNMLKSITLLWDNLLLTVRNRLGFLWSAEGFPVPRKEWATCVSKCRALAGLFA